MDQKDIVYSNWTIKTAIWCWLTKMLLQWVIVCVPSISILAYICPDVAPLLFFRLLGYSLILASLSTAVMIRGKIRVNKEGLYYDNGVLFKHQFIPWNKMEFGTPFPFTLERPTVIVKSGTKEHIKIWPTLSNYQDLKKYFADHKILLEEKRIVANSNADFRPLDDVLNEAFGSRR